MKIATFNANSIRVRLPIILDWLKKENPDILAIQETKVPDENFPRVPIEEAGWSVTYRGQKSYNGVAFISKAPLKNIQTRLDTLNNNEEARFLSGQCGSLQIINTYVPQGYLPDSQKFQMKLKFFKDLKTYFCHAIKKDLPALWLGDLNVAPTEIDLWDPSRNAEHVCYHPRVRQAFEEVCQNQWIDLFREKEKDPGHYTFWDYLQPTNLEKNRGWRIDHIMGTKKILSSLKNIWIDKKPRYQEKPSDHTFVIAEFNNF